MASAGPSSSTMLTYLVIASLCLKFGCCDPDQVQPDYLHVTDFDVKPGGTTYKFEETWKGVTCSISYACQGGTNEKWKFSMTLSEDGSEIGCSVERPGGTSYLFFQMFEMYISRGTVLEASAYGNGGPLTGDEYVIETEKNLVKSVDDKFQSSLTKLEVRARYSRVEL